MKAGDRILFQKNSQGDRDVIEGTILEISDRKYVKIKTLDGNTVWTPMHSIKIMETLSSDAEDESELICEENENKN